jgi:transposase
VVAKSGSPRCRHPGRRPRRSTDHRKQKTRGMTPIFCPLPRLKDWRRVATRYDRGARAFLSAVALAATAVFRL